jgi:hypothetical protein
MDNFLTLSPELIATGKVTRDQLTNLIYKAAKACNLDPIEKLRFYRELEKAAGNAVKMDDPEYGISIDKAAADFAETLPEVQEVLADGKKEFEYKNCRYQYKENKEAIDLSDSDKYTGEHAVSWRAENKEFKRLEKEIKDLKAKQQKCKNNMNTDAERYVDKHPKFVVQTEHYIAVV